jgi:hypothetical protein
MAQIGVEAISEVQGASRAAKTYAFLQATFARSASSDSPVRDAVECLVPFIRPFLLKYPGRQVDLTALQEFLKSNFCLEVPLCALHQLLPSLAKLGYAEYRKATKIYVAKSTKDASKDEVDKFSLAKEEIDTEFDEITKRLELYANDLGAAIIPPSGSWGATVISFLKLKLPEETPKFALVKGAMINPHVIERTVVAGFIRDSYYKEPHYFQMILRIFMGSLIEDLISTIGGVGSRDHLKKLVVFYDTDVLMRALGCCGFLLQDATVEMTRYLQDIGIREILYFSGNETEVIGILDAILNKKQTGGEIYGETADALTNNEISYAKLLSLKGTYGTDLGLLNVFPAKDYENYDPNLNQYQIDEKGFAETIASRAARAGKTYGDKNKENDANYVAQVVRLRRGFRTRDFAESRFMFVTTNTLLTSAARQFLTKAKVLRDSDCPAVLHVGQASTIAWLMKDKKLQSQSAGRELLANCYAAVQPDSAWFQAFRESVEKTVGNLETYAEDATNNLVLQAARRIAKDATFGNAAIMRTLPIAELIERSNRAAEKRIEEIRQQERAQADKKLESSLADQRTKIHEEWAGKIATFARKGIGYFHYCHFSRLRSIV